MIEVPVDVAGVVAQRDVASDRWRIEHRGQARWLRPWTWGERRRLLAAATACGRLDGEVFLDGLFELLLSPRPPIDTRCGHAVAALELLGVPRDGSALPLGRGELLLAERCGFSPGELEAQAAPALDGLVRQLSGTGATAPDPAYGHPAYGHPAYGQPAHTPSGEGWTSIVVADEPPVQADESGRLHGRLAELLEAVAVWAGVAAAAEDDAAEPRPVAAEAPAVAHDPQPDRPARLAASEEGDARRAGEPSVGAGSAPLRAQPSPAAVAAPPAAPGAARPGPAVFPGTARLAPPRRRDSAAWRSDPAAGRPAAMPPAAAAAASEPAVSNDVTDFGTFRLRAPRRSTASDPPPRRPPTLPSVTATEPSSPAAAELESTRTPKAHPPWGDAPATATVLPHPTLERAAGSPPRLADGSPLAAPAAHPAFTWEPLAGGPTAAPPPLLAVAGGEPFAAAAPAPLAAAAAALAEDPFADSELEERLADVLERAAREAGVDLS